MLRRCLVRRAGPYARVGESVSGDEGFMTLQQACTIFGFQLNDTWTRREVKKRYRSLALRFHPDHGGTDAQFRALAEAHKLLLTHRHNKADDDDDDTAAGTATTAKASSSRRRATVFHRVHYDDLHNTPHRHGADAEELRSVGVRDVVLFLACAIIAVGYYVQRTLQTQEHILRSRWSYTRAQVAEAASGGGADAGSSRGEGDERSSGRDSGHDTRAWHPWRADVETTDRMDRVGLLQGNIRHEVVAEREARAPTVHMPWHAGGPFAVRPVTTTTAATATTTSTTAQSSA